MSADEKNWIILTRASSVGKSQQRGPPAQHEPIQDLEGCRRQLTKLRREQAALGQSVLSVQAEIEAIDRACQDEIALLRRIKDAFP